MTSTMKSVLLLVSFCCVFAVAMCYGCGCESPCGYPAYIPYESPCGCGYPVYNPYESPCGCGYPANIPYESPCGCLPLCGCDCVTIPPLPPVLGCGTHLRKIVIPPPCI
ncbi:uncharacterized protein LOC128198954 [Bicyclus anynana]|uniref:Uncharacterized protein LOC128198954 n=1 Tax=Bicyclus anynana TaxID=110368 RepID=A0ABM3LV13_BICAN|nr:uncharacterized protein LOC128198954 [Bicyclus anynana]